MAAGRDPEEQQEDGGQAGMVVCLQDHKNIVEEGQEKMLSPEQ